jgi:hypothetical protein
LPGKTLAPTEIRLRAPSGLFAIGCEVTGAAVPGEVRIENRYLQFQKSLPAMCLTNGVAATRLSFLDYRAFVDGWRAENP